MPEANWNVFATLPGATNANFERLCRSIVQGHYSSYGEFRSLANQPGVEFHLKLDSPCELGESGRWFGWQCKWYNLPSGRSIGSARRRDIQDALAKTEEVLPNLTDWVLCTRYPLTASDQEWFYRLQENMKLHLWSSVDVEERLGGPALILRSTYFGELILTPSLLKELHEEAVAQIKNRWQPEIHQELGAERTVRRNLGAMAAWPDLPALAEQLESGAIALTGDLPDVPHPLSEEVTRLVQVAHVLVGILRQTQTALVNGDYEVLRQEFADHARPTRDWEVLLSRLRAGRYRASLDATNLVADIRGSYEALSSLGRALGRRLVAVLAEWGCGKTELAGQLTAATGDRLAGILLFGGDLQAGDTLDDLAGRVTIQGERVQTFEALVASLDAAGQRAGRRLPIVIDGLNEAEDPRDWKGPLASVDVIMKKYPYVLVVCTLRPAFVQDALPDGMDRLEMAGFEDDTGEAVARYFQYYRIDPTDAPLPWELLGHPLTLRMFCEVTNPNREQTVGVEAMPGSLTALFDRYLDQVAERIQELSPRTERYYKSDIRTALDCIGLALWEKKTRNIDMQEIRQLIGDDRRTWDKSIVRALEDDGVLIRERGDQPSRGNVAVVHDALAGHLVADALLNKFSGRDFGPWLQSASGTVLMGDISEQHPLATDIFRSLVGLSPYRRHRSQLWPLLENSSKTQALFEAAWLEAAHLDGNTVSELARLVGASPNGRQDVLDRIWSTRAARSHPLDAEFLDSVLRPMSIPDRDLRWTEWVRCKQAAMIKDLQRLEDGWQTGEPGHADDRLRARWAMWILTSTVRRLRDQATRALYRFGCMDPHALFDLALDSLDVNDPYVPERMLAACYGVAMSLWADPQGEQLRAALPAFAELLVDRMFVPGAPCGTRHVLMRDSAAGLVTLADLVKPGCISEDKMCYMSGFKYIPSPFPEADTIKESDVVEAKQAIQMDFGNYTIGRLIPNRGNYDYDNPTYRDVRRQVYWRILELGYSPSKFREIDEAIGRDAWRPGRRDGRKTDRYGKKYSWIAYFEMYGLRLDDDILPEYADKRSSDVDIDPSFPAPPKTWLPALPDPFVDAPTEPRLWLDDGPTPDYRHVLDPKCVDECERPWILLNGYIEQSAVTDDRRVFTFLWCFFVDADRRSELVAALHSADDPWNSIPQPHSDHYTYAGEIPWSRGFGSDLRDSGGRALPDRQAACRAYTDSGAQTGIPVEVPVFMFAWESYHSELNQDSNVYVPAPALCEQLGLCNHHGEWDMYDQDSEVATMYRESKQERDTSASHLTYIRSDLLDKYLRESGQVQVWLSWGERSFHLHSVHNSMDEMWKRSPRYWRTYHFGVDPLWWTPQ